SKVFPRLTEISTKRRGDDFGGYGSTTPEQHYYTQDEIRELVKFAADLGIEIVPEVDIPGHVSAILAAYPELSCTGKPVDVEITAGIFSNIFCAGNEQVYEFIEALFTELCDLFPGRYFHIGGDEVPKIEWKSCPKCQQMMKDKGLKNELQLQGHFQNRIADFLMAKGKTVIAWNEAAAGGNLNPNVLLQLWNDEPDGPDMEENQFVDENGDVVSLNQGIGAKHLAAGGRVISSIIRNSYCDYPYDAVTPESVFKADLLPNKCPDTPDYRSRILGGDGLGWSEHIRTRERLEYQLWPRYALKAINLYCGTPDMEFEEFMGEYGPEMYELIRSFDIKPGAI
ncbi:MAG: family 20 glycosylhydrolase, partial [Oscillospiraceae bacterium]|nr:family 20 glycosylhydrolase [Oscillospiraceae bacterium]